MSWSIIKKRIMKKSLVLLLFICFTMNLYSQNNSNKIYSEFTEKDEYFVTKYGLKNNITGRVVIKPKYDNILCEDDKHVYVVMGNLMGVIDTNSKVIVKLGNYDDLSNITDRRIFVSKGGKFALMGLNGVLYTGYTFDECYEMSEGTFKVRVDKKFGVIDTLGKIIVPIQYDKLTQCIKGKFAGVKIRVTSTNMGEYKTNGISQGNLTIPINNYETHLLNKKGIILYKSTGDENAIVIGNGLLCKIRSGQDCNSNDFIVELLDPTLKQTISYSQCLHISDINDYWIVIKDTHTKKVGLCSLNGEILLKPIYEEISDYDPSTNTATVKFDDQNSFQINKLAKRKE